METREAHKQNRFLVLYERMMDDLRSRIFKERDLNRLLRLASFYGQMRWQNNDGVYSDPELETYVIHAVLEKANLNLSDRNSQGEESVLIASELYDGGGHSRVVENWLLSEADFRDHSLVVSHGLTPKIIQSLQRDRIPFHICCGNGIRLIQEIISWCSNAKRIILHIHPDDIYSSVAAAFLSSKGKEVFFYNHADHVFSYGMIVSDVICEISSYGVEINRKFGRVLKSSTFLGIPIAHKSAYKARNANQLKMILSSGSAYKFCPSSTSFCNFIDSMLSSRDDVEIVLIGPNGKEVWWEDIKKRWKKKVVFYGEIPHDQYSSVVEQADVYMDSIPVTGGTAFPEALIRGLFVSGINNSIQGYSPVDKLRVDSISELVVRVSEILDLDSCQIKKQKNVREVTSKFHSIEAFHSRLRGMYEGKYDTCPWNGEVPIDTEWIVRDWLGKQELQGYRTSLLFQMPWPVLFRVLLIILVSQQIGIQDYFKFACSRLLVRILPSRWRVALVAHREEQLKAKSWLKAAPRRGDT